MIDSMEVPEALIRDKKIRCTPQRLAILRILTVAQRHLSAEEIYCTVRKTMPAVSLATVYTVLEMFTQKELIDEIRITFQRSLFELHRLPHHHFLCRKCGVIVDIDLGPCPVYKEGQAAGHRIESFQGYFYGTCEVCVQRRKKKDA